MSRTLALGLVLFAGLAAAGRPPNARIGEAVPRDVRKSTTRACSISRRPRPKPANGGEASKVRASRAWR